jgi:hypothetical protein
LLNVLERINSKILLKITLLVLIETILIIGSFCVLAYFQSQQSSLGNSINIAGKNRYLTANLAYLRNQAAEKIKEYVNVKLREEYEKCLVGLTAILKEAWTTAANSEDNEK